MSDAQSGNEIAPAIMEELNNLFALFVPPKENKEVYNGLSNYTQSVHTCTCIVLFCCEYRLLSFLQDATSEHDKIDRSASSRGCTIIPYGDVVKEKTFQLKNSEQLDIAECDTTINQLSGFATLLFPSREVNSSHKADIHALEHFCLSENITPMGLNHALILMSLEHVKLPNASTLPRQCYKNNSEMKEHLLFDHPFTIPICTPTSQDKALLPVSQASSSVGRLSEGPTGPFELDLPDPLTDLSKYSTLKVLKQGVTSAVTSVPASNPSLH